MWPIVINIKIFFYCDVVYAIMHHFSLQKMKKKNWQKNCNHIIENDSNFKTQVKPITVMRLWM